MVIFEVLSANGVPPDPPVRALLKAGDCIGRGTHTALPLPDPERRMSRVHAQVASRKHGVRIVARGNAPLLINGTALEIGEEADLSEGARIEIGGYVLSAHLQPKTASK